MEQLRKIGLGGGCHWCTEGVFNHLRGVERVEQGWIASQPPHGAYSEAITLHYDPREISLVQLIDVHLRTHSATVRHGLRHRYRSAVYYFDEAYAPAAERALQQAAARWADPVLTKVLPFVSFKPALPEHQDYYRTDPERPFCVRYIQPKLDNLRGSHPDLLLG